MKKQKMDGASQRLLCSIGEHFRIEKTGRIASQGVTICQVSYNQAVLL